MSDQRDTFQRIDALIQVGLRLARTAPSGRLLLARIADAIDPGWLPGQWGETIAAELIAAQASASPPIGGRQVESQLRDAWGVKPADELDELERDPVAVTPASQVHRGVLDGQPVAIKLRRPGLAGTVRQDLALLEGLLAPLGAAFPALDPGALVREFRQRVLDELDLEQEADNQRRFYRALRSHPEFVIPAPITRLAHEQVLVSEWVDGVPLAQAPDPDAACTQLMRFVVGGMRAGLMHADPDPRDVLVLDGGRIAILDYGAIAEPESSRVEAAAAAVEAFVAGDEEAFARALDQLGALPPEHAGSASALVRDVLGEFAGPEPVRLDGDAVLTLTERLENHPENLARMLRHGALVPADLWPARSIAQMFATIARVGATASWREELRQALRLGWDR